MVGWRMGSLGRLGTGRLGRRLGKGYAVRQSLDQPDSHANNERDAEWENDDADCEQHQECQSFGRGRAGELTAFVACVWQPVQSRLDSGPW
jgi:hypothetical protein